MTAAEIAAAEAAAATAASEAAAAAAAQQAAQAAATEAATQAAAQQTAQQGITAAPGAAPPPVGAPATPPPPAGGIETVATPPPPTTSPPPAGGIETIPPPAGSTPAGSTPAGGIDTVSTPEGDALYEQLKQVFSERPVDTGTSPFYDTASTVTSDVPAPLVQNTAVPPPPAPSIDPNIISVPPGAESEIVAPEFESLTRKELADYTKSEVGSNPFLKAFQDVTKYMGENKFQTATLATTGLGYMGAFKPPGTPMPEKRQYKGQYSLSPNFRATSPEPNVYQEKRYNYASGGIAGTQNSYDDENGSDMARGGIASFAKGTPRERDPEADFARYYALMEGQAPEQPPAPSYVGRVGIAYDDDQDTRYQDPLTAALIRQGKASKRAGIAGPVIPRPKPLGVVNFAPAGTQQAASGGIMGYNLGGYADGGNPRLLKGPGDGMSDNIPAVIGSRQPARLADGEFVVPADVVSHLGNGSTDAGAKKLHQMMDKIRMARTGKKKQAPAVKPKKYMPK
jgi:hypothetical protein